MNTVPRTSRLALALLAVVAMAPTSLGHQVASAPDRPSAGPDDAVSLSRFVYPVPGQPSPVSGVPSESHAATTPQPPPAAEPASAAAAAPAAPSGATAPAASTAPAAATAPAASAAHAAATVVAPPSLRYLAGAGTIGSAASLAFSSLQLQSLGPAGTTTMIPGGAKNPDTNRQQTLVVFERFPGYTWIMNVDGTNLHPLSPTTGPGWMEPKFFPDGSRVVVTHSPTGASNELYSIDVVSGAITQLTNAPQYPFKWRPFVDASGSKLLVGYGSDPTNDPAMLHSHIGMAQLGAGPVTDFTALTPVDTAMPSFDPELSPDGGQLTYDAGGRIWMANADGTNAHAIADGRLSRFDKLVPGQVLFTHDVSVIDTHTELWSANYDGSNPQAVADGNVAESFCDLPAEALQPLRFHYQR